MSSDLQSFYKSYVRNPYNAWIADELCEWKAFAVAGGLNAMVEHAFRNANPGGQPGTMPYQQQLGAFRRRLPEAESHEHIRCVAEVYKHVELKDVTRTPNSFDDLSINEAGAFDCSFSSDFDVVRQQIGFPYRALNAAKLEWVPLREVVECCMNFWELHLNMPRQDR